MIRAAKTNAASRHRPSNGRPTALRKRPLKRAKPLAGVPPPEPCYQCVWNSCATHIPDSANGVRHSCSVRLPEKMCTPIASGRVAEPSGHIGTDRRGNGCRGRGGTGRGGRSVRPSGRTASDPATLDSEGSVRLSAHPVNLTPSRRISQISNGCNSQPAVQSPP